MACTRPLAAYKGPDGKIKFNSVEGYVDRPLQLKCGQCGGCRLERTRGWALRCMHEAQLHSNTCFLTLTYSNETLPEDLGLDVTHWQKFAKRVRKELGPFRFLHCGEYGEQNLRPHYHAIMFGHDFHEDRSLWKEKDGNRLYRSEKLDKLWGKGFATIGPVNFDTAAYVAKYALKKRTGPQAEDHYNRIDPSTGECWNVRPEYATMSRRPGIGYEWFKKYKRDVYPEDFVAAKGQKFRPPAYYDSLLEDGDPDCYREMLERRRSKVRAQSADHTPERLRVREKVGEAFARHVDSAKGDRL